MLLKYIKMRNDENPYLVDSNSLSELILRMLLARDGDLERLNLFAGSQASR